MRMVIPPHALMVTQQRMQGAPNVAPCMRLAEEVLPHFDLLCQSALTQKNGVSCFACSYIAVRCVGVASVAGFVMRTPTTRLYRREPTAPTDSSP